MILDDPSAPNSSRVSALILATPPPKDAMRSWPQPKKKGNFQPKKKMGKTTTLLGRLFGQTYFFDFFAWEKWSTVLEREPCGFKFGLLFFVSQFDFCQERAGLGAEIDKPRRKKGMLLNIDINHIWYNNNRTRCIVFFFRYMHLLSRSTAEALPGLNLFLVVAAVGIIQQLLQLLNAFLAHPGSHQHT